MHVQNLAQSKIRLKYIIWQATIGACVERCTGLYATNGILNALGKLSARRSC